MDEDKQRDWLTSDLFREARGLEYFGPDGEWTVCDVVKSDRSNVFTIELESGENYTVTVERN